MRRRGDGHYFNRKRRIRSRSVSRSSDSHKSELIVMKNQKHSWKPRRVMVVLLALAIVSFIALSRFPSTNLAQNQGDDPQAKELNVDKTLSPYFFVQGDPSVDQLPLKDTHVDVAISGVIADVKVVQTYRNRSEERRVGKECRSRW